MKPVGEMTTGEWIAYQEDRVEKFYEKGGVLIPTPGCSDCDPDEDYTCFACECTQLAKFLGEEEV